MPGRAGSEVPGGRELAGVAGVGRVFQGTGIGRVGDDLTA